MSNERCCASGCGSKTAPVEAAAALFTDSEDRHIIESVTNYYGKVIQQTKDLKTSACTTASKPHRLIREALKLVPKPIQDKFYGCGVTVPAGGIEGLSVLDLGCGAGRDCYMAANLVGPNGRVTGIDMTDEQLTVAREHAEHYTTKVLGYPQCNLRFVKGFIEFLGDAGIEPNSVDLVISNCVVNLSPQKQQVIEEVWKVLRVGGEMYFSDVYCDRRLPKHVQQHEVLFGECISGALYIEDFKRICRKVGFNDPRMVSIHPIRIADDELSDVVGEAKFYSITYRLFKLPNLEQGPCEDYGQIATYRGTLPGNTNSYTLDDHHLFEKGKPTPVCGNTASMLSETWLRSHFEVTGSREVHYGVFGACGGISLTATSGGEGGDSCSSSGGGCCGSA